MNKAHNYIYYIHYSVISCTSCNEYKFHQVSLCLCNYACNEVNTIYVYTYMHGRFKTAYYNDNDNLYAIIGCFFSSITQKEQQNYNNYTMQHILKQFCQCWNAQTLGLSSQY